MKKALLYVFVFLAILFLTQFVVLIAFVVFTGHPLEDTPVTVDIATMVIYSIVTLLVFLKMQWFSISRAYLRSHPWGVLFWCVVAALGAIVPSLFIQGLLPEWTGWAREIAESTNEQLESVMSVPGGYMVIALLPPVVEEMVFRGCVLRSLLKWKPQHSWLMIALSALLFALVHMNPAQAPHTFLIGLLLGWMYKRTGSFVPGIAYHWANNTAAYVMYHAYHNPQSLTDIIGPGQRPLLLALAFSLCIFLPALYQLNCRMKRIHSEDEQ